VSEARQLSLISEGELVEIIEQGAARAKDRDDATMCGVYTLQQFAAREPRLLQAVIRLRGAGMSIKDVAHLLNVGDKTVMAVDAEYAGNITTCKQRVGRRWMEVAELAADAARERLVSGAMAKEGLRDIVVAGATAMDKALLAAGEATEIRRVEFQAPGLADFSQQLAAMGLGSGMGAQKGTVDAVYTMDEGGLVDGQKGAPRAITDCESVALPLQRVERERVAVAGVMLVQSDEDLDGDEEADCGGRAAVASR